MTSPTPNGASHHSISPASGVLQFLHILEKLKTTKRTGWVNHKIPNPESISDHMHRMTVMAMVLKDPSLDREKCIRMAAVHDLGEAIVGDITPHDGVSDMDKHAQEAAAFDRFSDLLGHTSSALDMYALWREYEAGMTAEARLVKDLDKFEMIVQALEYERSHDTPLDGFFASTRGKFRHTEVKAWAEELYREREEMWKGMGVEKKGDGGEVEGDRGR